MKQIGRHMIMAAAFALATAQAQTGSSQAWDFEKDEVGRSPAGFEFSVTGKKQPGRWLVAKDSSNLVLAQLDRDKTPRRFAMALVKDAAYKDLRISVRAKPVAGDEEMVAGLVWRYQDPDNYYVARWNADSVRVDRVVAGERQLLPSSEIKIKLAPDAWHRLAVEHRGEQIRVFIDDVRVFEGMDLTYASPGRIGVWIKADSLTFFDDLKVEPL